MEARGVAQVQLCGGSEHSAMLISKIFEMIEVKRLRRSRWEIS
jgi:hypothetical protein